MKDGQESCFFSGDCQGGREISGKRTAVGLFVLDCESLMECVQSVTLQLEHGGDGQHERKRKICFAWFWLKDRYWAQPTASAHAVFPPPVLLSKGRVEGIVFQWLLCIRWGCQHSQIPSFLSLCSLLCVHLQFRSLLSKMILTGFGFMMSELKYVLHVHYGVCRNSPKEQLAESAMLPWDLRVDIIYFNVKNKCIL